MLSQNWLPPPQTKSWARPWKVEYNTITRHTTIGSCTTQRLLCLRQSMEFLAGHLIQYLVACVMRSGAVVKTPDAQSIGQGVLMLLQSFRRMSFGHLTLLHNQLYNWVPGYIHCWMWLYFRAVIAAWLNDSKINRVGVGMNSSSRL